MKNDSIKKEALPVGRKALIINDDLERYGTFAEIGAGQEVARHFFQVGKASSTIAKTMSAYDMTFSDEIYGKGERYVSCARLKGMLEHEFTLLQERLGPKRGHETCFFTFADTVATSSHDDDHKCHGWMGIRFQEKAGGPTNDIYLHVRMFDRFRLQQQEALGVLGVNLIYSAFYLKSTPTELVSSLRDDLGDDRIEIDYFHAEGPDLNHLDNRLVSLELVNQGLTNAILFGPNGQEIMAADALYKKPLLVMRGTYRPITNTNMEILKRSLEQMQKNHKFSEKPYVLLETTMDKLKRDNSPQQKLDTRDFLNRVDTVAALNHYLLITNFKLFYQVKNYLRRCTDDWITIVIGAGSLEKLLNASYYQNLKGGILQAFGELFDSKSQIYVFPYKSEMLCSTAKTFHPVAELKPLYEYLLSNNYISDILGCDDVDTSIHSSDVRKMLSSGDASWEKLVPGAVSELIKKQKLFDYGSKK